MAKFYHCGISRNISDGDLRTFPAVEQGDSQGIGLPPIHSWMVGVQHLHGLAVLLYSSLQSAIAGTPVGCAQMHLDALGPQQCVPLALAAMRPADLVVAGESAWSAAMGDPALPEGLGRLLFVHVA